MMRFLLSACLSVMVPLAASAAGSPGAHFVENWDLDANGAVTLEEIKERRGDVFFMFDQDENDILSAEEYVLFDETRAADMAENAGGHAGRNEGGRMQEGLTRGFNDTNMDGQVSRAEFLARSTAWFEMIDRTGDGVVTLNDFGPRSN